jgi:hypothetical protein
MTNPTIDVMTFNATYVTPSSEIARVREEQSVNLYIDVSEVGTQVGFVGQTTIFVGNAVSLVESVTVDGINIPFFRQLTDQRIYWDISHALTRKSTIEVTLGDLLGSFSLLNGTLPPGLSITPKGLITGRVTNIIAPPAPYAFTVRYKNPTHTHDRRFVIYAEGKDYPAFFNPDQLQPQERDDEMGFSYRSLGSLSRGQGFGLTLDIYDPDGVLPGFVLRKVTGFRPNSGKFGGLPPDLEIVGQTIQGVVAADACPGKYFFEVVLNDSGRDGAIFMIEILQPISNTIGVIPHVVWDTPEGDLGSIVETEPSHFDVVAHSVNAPAIVYELAPFSAPLPTGVTINPLTGRLYGVMPYVVSDTVFSFRLRASAGQLFADRIFSITVLAHFDLDTIHNLRLQIRTADEVALVPQYADSIPQELIYRSEDPNFGFIRHPYVYVIKGIDGSKNLEEALRGDANGLEIVGGQKDYQKRFKLVLGEHRFATARDSTGKAIYEVLYRDLYDPMKKAGGFNITNGLITSSPVRWPQSASTSMYFFPHSVKNMRFDLIENLGFAMIDPDSRRNVGTDTAELMPLWMRSEQVKGVASSVPGYKAALFLAYLKPGSAAAVQKILNAVTKVGTLITPWGHVYYFDKYFTTETSVLYQTMLDNQDDESAETVIDSTETVFDEVDGDVVKYLD